MTVVDRAAVRKAVAAMLENSMVGDGLPAQAVYAYQVSDFQDQSPVLVVMSAGSRRRPFPSGVDSYVNEFRLEVDIFTADANAAAGWTDEAVENRIDLLEKSLAEVVASHRTFSLWKFLDFEDGLTTVGSVSIGGKPYKMEQVYLRVTVY